MKEWQKIGSESGRDERLFRIRYDDLVNPRNGETLRATVLETPQWVNVVAVLRDGRFVMVRQFRFGTAQLSLEIPGGLVDPGEAPRAAAERELLEETGHRADRWQSLGALQPNPAFHNNLCHYFLATGCERVAEQALDLGEDIEIVVLTREEILAAVREGALCHSLVIAGLSRVLDLRTTQL